MAQPKRTITLRRQDWNDKTSYIVVKLVNTLEPDIGTRLSKSEVEHLVQRPNNTVVILPEN